MKSVNNDEIEFEISSVIDPVGRIFKHDGRVFRAINDAHVVRTIEVLKLAEKHRWFEAGLIETKIADFQIEGYGIVLEHKRVTHVTQRGEWSAAGLRKAALCHLTLCMQMLKIDYCLKDAHTWNMLFNGTKPVYIDFSSVAKFEGFDAKYWLSEFYSSYLAPLLLFADGQTGLGRAITQEHVHGAGLWLLQHNPDLIVKLPDINDITIQSLEFLYCMIEGLKFPNEGGEWNDYISTEQELREKDIQFIDQIKLIDFKTVIDIGANRGIHASICAKQGAEVLACDVEEACLNAMFEQADAHGLNLTPIFLDITRPIGSGGIFSSQRPATERLRSDLVVALALVHHVSFRQRYYVDSVLRTISSFSKRSALIEFVPDDDIHVKNWNLPSLPKYTFDGFREELKKHYEFVENIPFSTEPRSLFVCHGKRA